MEPPGCQIRGIKLYPQDQLWINLSLSLTNNLQGDGEKLIKELVLNKKKMHAAILFMLPCFRRGKPGHRSMVASQETSDLPK